MREQRKSGRAHRYALRLAVVMILNLSQSQADPLTWKSNTAEMNRRKRRMSHGRLLCPFIRLIQTPTDPASRNNRRFIVDVDETLRIILEQEDTDGDFQVGPSSVSSSSSLQPLDQRHRFGPQAHHARDGYEQRSQDF